jgi:hypothetical protein
VSRPCRVDKARVIETHAVPSLALDACSSSPRRVGPVRRKSNFSFAVGHRSSREFPPIYICTIEKAGKIREVRKPMNDGGNSAALFLLMEAVTRDNRNQGCTSLDACSSFLPLRRRISPVGGNPNFGFEAGYRSSFALSSCTTGSRIPRTNGENQEALPTESCTAIASSSIYHKELELSFTTPFCYLALIERPRTSPTRLTTSFSCAYGSG